MDVNNINDTTFTKNKNNHKNRRKRKGNANTKENMMDTINLIWDEIKSIEFDEAPKQNDFLTMNIDAILKELIMTEAIKDMIKSDTGFEPKLTRAKVKELVASREELQMAIPTQPLNRNLASECLSLMLEDDSSYNSSEDESYIPYNENKRSRLNINSDDVTGFEPKLTRAKVKELTNGITDFEENVLNGPYNYMEGSECLTLLRDDLCYNSSDDESYIPDNEATRSRLNSTSDTLNDHNLEIRISARTRSKLPLNETAVEEVELQFEPPDDVSHYDPYDEFLKECFSELQDPIPFRQQDIDDDPEDPEYIIQDEEEVDGEEWRMDKEVEVTTSEVKELITDRAISYKPILMRDQSNQGNVFSSTEDHEPGQNHREIVPGDEELSNNIDVESPSQYLKTLPRTIVSKPIFNKSNIPVINSAQILLLQQQLCQHVQLTLIHFLQCYKHSHLHTYAIKMKTILLNFQTLSEMNKNSILYPKNLDSALELVKQWENEWKDKKIEFYENTFPNVMMKLVCKSDAIMYPLLLPKMPFVLKRYTIKKREMNGSEEWLLANGLHHFSQFVREKNSNKNETTISNQTETYKLIAFYVFSNQFTASFLRKVIEKAKNKDTTYRHIQFYLEHERAPAVEDRYVPVTKKPLCQQSLPLIPDPWATYIKNNFYIKHRNKYIKLVA